MTNEKPPVTIKKYANRRLYNTGTSTYVTLEDLAAMVKRGDDFVVYDAKGGEDITRSVLAQIIFEQEGKNGQNLLPVTFLRQLIRFYGDSMQMLVPSYLELSMDTLTKERKGFGDVFGQSAFTSAMMKNPVAEVSRPIFAQMEEQTRQNVAMFRQALGVFSSMAGSAAPVSRDDKGKTTGAPTSPAHQVPPLHQAPPTQQPAGELDDMRRQIDDLQRRLESMAPKA